MEKVALECVKPFLAPPFFTVAQTTKHFNFVKKESSNALSQTAFVFATEKYSDFVLVQTNFHYDWSIIW
jgi:hypothetical protein